MLDFTATPAQAEHIAKHPKGAFVVKVEGVPEGWSVRGIVPKGIWVGAPRRKVIAPPLPVGSVVRILEACVECGHDEEYQMAECARAVPSLCKRPSPTTVRITSAVPKKAGELTDEERTLINTAAETRLWWKEEFKHDALLWHYQYEHEQRPETR